MVKVFAILLVLILFSYCQSEKSREKKSVLIANKIVELIDSALMNREQASEISSLRKEVKELMGSRPLFTWE